MRLVLEESIEDELNEKENNQDETIDEVLDVIEPFNSSVLIQSDFSQTIFIKTVQDLKDISKNLKGSYVLVNDIDMANENWVAIGDYSQKFTGTLDGNGYKIKNLNISGAPNNTGLFGYIESATIKNLILEDVNLNGGHCTGGITGLSDYSTITNCAVVGGTISGFDHVGGITGHLRETLIEECYSSVDILAYSKYVGGISGSLNYNSTIKNSFSESNVGGGGGITGSTYGSNVIENCYFAGKLSNISQRILYENGIDVKNSFALGLNKVDFTTDKNNMVKTFEQLQDIKTFENWDFNSVWEMSSNTKMPVLKKFRYLGSRKIGTYSNPILISTTEDLKSIKNKLNANYKLTNDIDLTNESWTAIGNDLQKFTGTLDGNGYKIKNLKISGAPNNTGLFGYISYANIKNVGGISGSLNNNSTIKDSFSESNVGGGGEITGSTFGPNLIENCYFGGKLSNVSQRVLYENGIDVKNSFALGLNKVDFTTDKNNRLKTYEQLQDVNTFENWDFDSVWEMNSNTKLPVLKKFRTLDTSKIGTYSNPILISTTEDLKSIKNKLNANYKLTNDIDLINESWTAIGNDSQKFTGTLDGNGYKIKNLKINGAPNGTGLFGYIAFSNIKNLILENVNLNGGHCTGGITGLADYSTIFNCMLVGGTISGIDHVGGISGLVSETIIEQCSSDVDIKAYSKYVGGISGTLNTNSTVKNSFSKSNVGGGGGLIGQSYSTSNLIENSYFAGTMPNKIISLSDSPVNTIASYFDLNKAENGNYKRGDQAKTTSQLKQKATFVDWNFTNVWSIDEGVNYPYLTHKGSNATESLNNISLNWPTESGEITLWFGHVDEQYQVSHKGIDIQGAPNDIVYSIGDGEVVYNGTHSYYGNVVYVNYQYEGRNMQVRYAHLSSQPDLSVGQIIHKGDQIGTMSTDSSSGNGITELTILESTDGEVCSLINFNTVPIDPMNFLKRPDCLELYLSYPMATTLDITNASTSLIAPRAARNAEDPDGPDARYRDNKDIDVNTESYLRKIVLEYVSASGINVNPDDLDKRGILVYNAYNDTATVKLNNRSVTYGVNFGNAVYVNKRLVVKRDKFWYDFVGYKYSNFHLATEGYFQKLDYALSEEKIKAERSFSSYSYYLSDYDFKITIDALVAGKATQIMMHDVNNYGDTDLIPDDPWRKFCIKFNENVVLMPIGTKEVHYFRNKLNRAPNTLEEMETINRFLPEGKKWRLLRYDKSVYHMYRTKFSPEGESNLKFVSYDGIYEGVYNKDGILLTEKNDPWNMGTYNYVNPSDWVGHIGEDVYPYDWWGGNWGNVEGAGLPTTSIDVNKKNYENSKSAQDHRAAFESRFKGVIEKP